MLFFQYSFWTVFISAASMGFALDCYNLAGAVVGAQLNETKPSLMASIVNDGTIMGLLIGSLVTGKILSIGRWRTIQLGNIIVILGCLPQMALNIWA